MHNFIRVHCTLYRIKSGNIRRTRDAWRHDGESLCECGGAFHSSGRKSTGSRTQRMMMTSDCGIRIIAYYLPSPGAALTPPTASCMPRDPLPLRTNRPELNTSSCSSDSESLTRARRAAGKETDAVDGRSKGTFESVFHRKRREKIIATLQKEMIEWRKRRTRRSLRCTIVHQNKIAKRRT